MSISILHPSRLVKKGCSKGTLNGNPTPETPYSKIIFVQLVERETNNVQGSTWTKYDMSTCHLRPLRLYQKMP